MKRLLFFLLFYYFSLNPFIISFTDKEDPLLVMLYRYGPTGSVGGSHSVLAHQILGSAPPAVITQLASYYGFSGSVDAIRALLLKEAYKGALELSIKFFDPVNIIESQQDRIYNIFFHNVVREWMNKQTGDIQRNIHAGIFKPSGIELVPGHTSFPLDALKDVDVNYHGGMYSPANAYIKLTPERSVATGWLFGGLKEKGRALLSFVVFGSILDDQLNIDIYYAKNPLKELTILVKNLTKKANLYKSADKEALNGVIEILKTLLLDVTQEQTQLKEKLTKLATSLSALQKKI